MEIPSPAVLPYIQIFSFQRKGETYFNLFLFETITRHGKAEMVKSNEDSFRFSSYEVGQLMGGN